MADLIGSKRELSEVFPWCGVAGGFRFLLEADAGLFLELVAYVIVTENNAA